MSNEITIRIEAMEATALFDRGVRDRPTPDGVWLRMEGHGPAGGDMIAVRGPGHQVATFVADNWGPQELETWEILQAFCEQSYDGGWHPVAPSTWNPETIAAILASEILKMNEDLSGAKPAESDYIIVADLLLMAHYRGYIGSTAEGRDFLANEIYEDAGKTYNDAQTLAAHIVDALTAE